MTDLVSIGFKADTSDLSKAGREFDNLSRKGSKVERDVTRSTKGMSGGFSSLAKTVGIASAAITAFGASMAVSGAKRYAESMTNIQNQLRLVSNSSADLVRQQEALLSVSNRSRAGFEETARLYTTIRRNTEELGLSEERLLRVTETINKSFAVTGTTAQEASGAIRQLSQGLAAGALRGDEFNSVAEGAPEILRAVAAETGMAIGALREFAADGGITAELLIRSLENYGETVDKIFSNSAKTISQSMTVARNNFTDFIGGADSVQNAARMFGGAVVALSENLDTISNTIKLGTGLLATYIATVYTIPAATTAASAATTAYTAVLAAFNGQASITVARLGLMQSTLAVLGAAFAGFQIGSYLRNEFEIVEKAGIALASGLTQMSAQIMGKFRELGESIRFALVNPLDYARNKIIDFIEWVNGLGSAALNFLGLEDLAEKISSDLTSLRGTTGEEHKKLLAQIAEETKLEVEQIDAIYGQMFMSVGQASATASETINNTNETAANSIQAVTDSVSELNNEITALTAADQQWMDSQIALEKSVADLNNQLNPQIASMSEWIEKEAMLDKALKQGIITVDKHAEMVQQLGESFEFAGESQKDLVKNADQEASAFQTAWERGIERIDDMFADLWTSAFDGFKDFGSTLKKSFTGLLAELAHAAITRPIVMQFQNAFTGGGGSTGAAGALAGATGGSGTSILGAIQMGLRGGNDAIVEGIAKLGVSIGGDFEGISGTLGNFLIENNAAIARVLPYAGAALSLIQGDVKGAIFQGAGVAIGSFFGGPLGGAIGGAIGSVVGGLFGGNKQPPRSGGIASASSVDGVISSRNMTGWGEYDPSITGGIRNATTAFVTSLDALQKGFGIQKDIYASARYSGRDGGSSYSGFSGGGIDTGTQRNKDAYGQEDLEAFLGRIVGTYLVQAIRKSDIPSQVKNLFNGLTDNTVINNMIQASISLNEAQEQLADQFGLTVNQAAQVAMASGAAGDELAAMVSYIAQTADGTKTLGRQLVRIRESMEEIYGGALPASLKDFDTALKAIDTTTKAGIESFYELFALREGFADYTAGINELKGAVSGAVFGLLNPTEQLKQMRANTGALFEEFGLEVPNSVQGLIQIASGIDYMTEEGLNLASVFPALVDAFMQTREQADALADSLSSLDSSRFSNVVDFRRSVALNQNGIPGFASGGYHSGGLRVVGENGPEVEATAPSRIFNQDQLIDMRPMAQEIAALRSEVAAMRYGNNEIARNTKTTADVLQRVTRDGNALLTESAA